MRTIGLYAICLAGCTWVFSPPPAHAQDSVPARLSLAEALRLVEERHPALAGARARVAAAQADADIARQRPNPTLSFSSEGYRPWHEGGRSANDQEAVFEVSQEVETGGRRRLRTAAAAAAKAVSQATADDERRRLRLTAERAYFALVLARSELETADASLTEVDQVIAVNRARYRQGEISGGELRRLEVERMRFTDDVLAARLAEKNARSALLALLGAARLDAPLEATDGLKAPASTAQPGLAEARAAIDPGALIARALARRPDLAAARGEEERAQSEVRLQQALRLPTVTFGAGYRREFGENGLALSASVPLPLFDRNAGGIARAQADRRLAASQTLAAERAVSLEVQQAVNAVDTMKARLTALESDYLHKAREARDTALAAYRSGATDLIDYLDAQRAYREVQRAYQRALFDHRMSLSELDAAVGALPGDLLP